MSEDLELDVTEESAEEESSGSLKYEIMNYPADTTLSGYLDMWKNQQLVIPKFQRNYVWDQVKASKLIESFLLGLPVPGVFLFKEKNSSHYLIIDGQQRITSIVYFLMGVYKENVFRLKNVAPKWDKKRFEDLSEQDQFSLKSSVLRSTIIQQINPTDNSSIYPIFERLNTGGVNLNPMEIRQCVSFGPFVETLNEMNVNEHWRKIVGSDTPDARLRDVELVLRSLALAENFGAYEKPMKAFLNDFMEMNRNKTAKYADYKQKFFVTCQRIVHALGEKPFHLRGKLNYGVLDSVFNALYHNEDVHDISTKYQALIANEEYYGAVTLNTSDNAEVDKRIKIAMKILV